MLRHDFQPGRLVVGLTLILAGVLYAGDATGSWDIPWFVLFPVMSAGLCLAATAGLAARGIRRRRVSPEERQGVPGADPPE
ncbi:hypothetical protein [Streptomyces sp. SHP 1-2]|uniref:hypothetical protein n=1 Tax=Streptomyces sp. SHP 1-2 TaxID=2769489 RepID=UPI002237A6FB|nr:hypothetical protein [Streptomyces sp. SHP 1-2]MCW5251562.1 hypothetical protein [Streptomyces sp. SHP 1-2]